VWNVTTIAEIEKAITDLGYGTPEYHEALGMYFMVLARSQWRRADQLRNARMNRQRRSRRNTDADPAAGEV
jgi:hypothetical protein